LSKRSPFHPCIAPALLLLLPFTLGSQSCEKEIDLGTGYLAAGTETTDGGHKGSAGRASLPPEGGPFKVPCGKYSCDIRWEFCCDWGCSRRPCEDSRDCEHAACGQSPPEDKKCPNGITIQPDCRHGSDGQCVWEVDECPVNTTEPCSSCLKGEEYCEVEICADDNGTCRTSPSVQSCGNYQSKPVCGCNGKLYDSICLANAAGTSVDFSGTCRGSK
jgi:hypothetical protein